MMGIFLWERKKIKFGTKEPEGSRFDRDNGTRILLCFRPEKPTTVSTLLKLHILNMINQPPVKFPPALFTTEGIRVSWPNQYGTGAIPVVP